MITKRILSILLAVLTLAGSFTLLASAAEEESNAPVYTYNTTSSKPTMNYFKSETIPASNKEKAQAIATPEDKLAMMDLRFEKDGYRLYVDEYSGEVATYCIATGEILFSNPYNVGEDKKDNGITPTENVKQELMSQLVVKYTDITSGSENVFYSYTEAAIKGQIKVKNIKNGIRVEYTIGREQARLLVPYLIEKSAFETKLRDVMKAAVDAIGTSSAKNHYDKFMAYYLELDPEKAVSDAARDKMYKDHPITKKMAVYAIDASTTDVNKARIEGWIKTYCPAYTYEQLEEDHLKTEYESEEQNPPLFKMALEYSLDEYGMTVRLPANGIRFNESLYRLDSIQILPYMGAGENPNEGYTFFPDGSGAIFDFQKIAALGATTTFTGKVYGQDFAYHTITGTHQEMIRYPVFGLAEKASMPRRQVVIDPETGEPKTTADGTVVTEIVEVEQQRGFVAIVEEGDALMELSSYHAVSSSDYNTVTMTVYPRPQDTYNIADAISVGSNATWTVVSDRKYTGNYKIRYVMLNDEKLGDAAVEAGDLETAYDCNYVGMAAAYRDYLVRNDILTKLTDEDVKEDIPLYIETFGAVRTTKKILSVPVEVMAPLTSFEDIKEMYGELGDEGIENINFILTGYAKGGMNERQVPYHLKWEKSVGGKKGFEDLVQYAEEKDFGIFPDFDFVFISGNGMFDGVSLKKHAIKTIDNRYTSKRVYSATKQTYMSYFEMALSPAYFSHFYEKLTENYLKYGATSISVSTLGNYLNSDFDEDDPYNRADAQQFTKEALAYLDRNFENVMTSGGNAYTWKYVDYITDIALDSSRYSQTGAAVPFLGMVLHGYVQFAGSPINMEGNIDYSILKALENGASLYFMLSYRQENTSILKEDEKLSQYYSVRYDIWFDDLVAIYNEVNTLLADLQTSTIQDHVFLDGIRIPDAEELAADAAAELKAAIEREEALRKEQEIAAANKLLTARDRIPAIASEMQKLSKKQINLMGESSTAKTEYLDALTALETKEADLQTELGKGEGETEAVVALRGEIQTLKDQIKTRLKRMYEAADELYTAEIKAGAYLAEAKELLQLLKTSNTLGAATIAELEAIVADIQLYYDGNGNANERPGFVTPANDAKDVAEFAYGKLSDEQIAKFQVVPYVQTLIEDQNNNEETEPEGTVDAKPFNKYAADENKIVYVLYENGTAFILNFNDYKVETEVGGVKYTIDGYGYAVLSK